MDSQLKDGNISSDDDVAAAEPAHEEVMRELLCQAFRSNHPMTQDDILYAGSVQHLSTRRPSIVQHTYPHRRQSIGESLHYYDPSHYHFYFYAGLELLKIKASYCALVFAFLSSLFPKH